MNSVVCAGLKRNILRIQGLGAKEISILFIITSYYYFYAMWIGLLIYHFIYSELTMGLLAI